MADRATWKGVLKVALVTIPIKVYPATESASGLSFNQLHESCSTRIQQRRWCPNCAREVANAEIVKGFEFEPGRFVVVSADELDAVSPPSARVIDLVQFSPVSTLPWAALERAYFLAPDGPVGGPAHEAYAVLCAVLPGSIGIGKVALYGREYLVAVGARAGALLLYTLHHAGELRAAPIMIPPERAGSFALPSPAVQLAQRVVLAMTAPLNLSAFRDDYQADVRRLIDAKIAGEEIVFPSVPMPTVLPLRDALVQSLAAVRATKGPRPVKVSIGERRKRAQANK